MRLFLILAAFLASVAPAIAEKRAFVLGNANYDELQPLRNTHYDAAAYRDAFEALGYEVWYHEDLDLDAMEDAFEAFLNRIEPGDQVSFVFAGHGWSDGATNYLIPTDAPVQASDRRLKRGSMELRNGRDGILDEIAAMGAALTVAIIDACRDNPFAPPEGTRSAALSRGLVRETVQTGTFVVFSAGAGQTALDRLPDDGPDQRLSVFSRNFIPQLKLPIPLEDAIATAQEQTAAMALTARGHVQHPAYYDQTLGKTCLAESCTAPARPEAGAASAPVARPDPWAQKAILQIPEGTLPARILDVPCRKLSGGRLRCEFAFGTTLDTAGQEQLRIWNLSSEKVSGTSVRIGSVEEIVRGGDFAPNGGFWDGLDLIFFARDRFKRFEDDFDQIDLEDYNFRSVDGDPMDWSALKRFGAGNIINDVAYDGVNDLFAVASFSDLYVFARHPDGRRSAHCFFDFGEFDFTRAEFSSDGTILAARYAGWTLLFDMPIAPSEFIDRFNDWPFCNDEAIQLLYAPFLDLSADGRYLAVAEEEFEVRGTPEDHVLMIYDAASLLRLGSEPAYTRPASQANRDTLVAILPGHESYISTAVFAPDATSVLSVTEDGVLSVWALPSGRLIGRWDGDGGMAVRRAEFVGTSGCVIARLENGGVVQLDPHTGDILQDFPEPSSDYFLLEDQETLVTYSFGQLPMRVYGYQGHVCTS